jgi:hypothetical protein
MFKNNGIVENSYGLTIVAAYSFFIGKKRHNWQRFGRTVLNIELFERQ